MIITIFLLKNKIFKSVEVKKWEKVGNVVLEADYN